MLFDILQLFSYYTTLFSKLKYLLFVFRRTRTKKIKPCYNRVGGLQRTTAQERERKWEAHTLRCPASRASYETPLPHDAPEFERMPKSTCQKCGIIMPLQFLALHITSCGNVDDVSITQILTLSEWSLVNFWISILYGKRDVAFLISRRGSLYVCLEIISQNAAQTSLCTLPGGKLSVPLKHLIYSLTFKS